jgi:hypothetical protein
MARPKVVRTKEEAANVPPNLPIQVEIGENDPVVPVTPKGNGEAAAVPVAPSPAPPVRDDGEITSLKAQLEQLKRDSDARTKQLNDQIAAAQQRETELRRQYDGRDQQHQSALARAMQAEIDAVDNAAIAAQGALDSAKSALAIAGQTQDWGAMAEAQERIAESKTRLVQLQDAKANLTERSQRAQQQQQTQQYQQQPSTNDAIDRMPISAEQKDWFKKHPDVLYDDFKMTKARMAHYDALNRGLTMNTPDYFEVIDVAMGYKQPPKSDDFIDEEPPNPPPQQFSAPVSRDTVSAATGRPATTRITLTAAQREAARDAGVDEVTYARGLMELERRKSAGYYEQR